MDDIGDLSPRREATPEITATMVSHTHWDREWYRPFEGFRARLIDTIDAVLDQLATDAGWCFLLDGQTVVIEDYLAIRPQRRAEMESACRAGRLAIGPWYVQPDSLLPSGEAHVRNLLEGRRVGEEIGPVSRVAYTPDSFGHPAQFPQLFAGFGLEPFVYWRGNGSELDSLAPVWRWAAPDGTTITACHLGEGYFAAAYLGADVDAAVTRMEKLAGTLGGTNVLFMNGLDHAPPDAITGEVTAALAERTGWHVQPGSVGALRGGRRCRPTPPCTAASSSAVVWPTSFPACGRPACTSSAATARRRPRSVGWAEPWSAIGAIARTGRRTSRPPPRLAFPAGQPGPRLDLRMLHRPPSTSRCFLAMTPPTGWRRRRPIGCLERLAGLGPTGGCGGTAVSTSPCSNPSPRPVSDWCGSPSTATRCS